MASIVEQLTLKDLPKKDKIITIDPSESIPEVFAKIFANRITSAPVVDKKNHNQLIGSISLIDVVFFTINVCQTSQELAKYFGLPPENKAPDFVDFENIKNFLTPDANIQQSTIADSAQFITNYSHQNLLQVLRPDSTFRDVVNVLRSAHRVAIGDDQIVNYVSQSEVVKLLKERGAYNALSSKTIEELQLGSKNVLSIKDTQKVIEAFKLIVTHKVTGVAVVDDNGQLQGQISISDIRNITTSGEMLPRLYETYHPYRKILVEKYNAPPKMITVPTGVTLSQVIDTIVTNSLHRVFVVDKDNHLISVITLTDLLKLV